MTNILWTPSIWHSCRWARPSLIRILIVLLAARRPRPFWSSATRFGARIWATREPWSQRGIMATLRHTHCPLTKSQTCQWKWKEYWWEAAGAIRIEMQTETRSVIVAEHEFCFGKFCPGIRQRGYAHGPLRDSRRMWLSVINLSLLDLVLVLITGPYRVWLQDEDIPGLAMSRSFGDLVATQVGVICEPEIR